MRWLPAHKDHAIERVATSFKFREALASKSWQRLLTAATVSFQQRGFNSSDVQVGFGQPIPGIQIAMAPGRVFRAITGNEVHEEVTLAADGFVYSTVLYDSWSRYKHRVMELLGIPLDLALSVVDLASIKLEYWDKFVFEGEPEEADYSELLRPASKHLPHFVFKAKQLWHSHIGYFVETGSSETRLINLNVDVLDLSDSQSRPANASPTPRRSTGIYSMAQDGVLKDQSPNKASETTSTLDEMHTILKEILADVISGQAAQRISLGGG